MLLAGPGFAQPDSLTLVVSSAYQPEDSAKSYPIRIAFTNRQQRPITLYKKPHRSFICCWDFDEEIGVEIQRLDSTCYTGINNCADCDDFFPPKYVKEDMIKLKHGETVSYSGDISLFDDMVETGSRWGSSVIIVVGLTGFIMLTQSERKPFPSGCTLTFQATNNMRLTAGS